MLDVCCQGKAVHVGHHGIEEHQRKRCPQVPCVRESGQCSLAALDYRWSHTPVAEHVAEDTTIGGIVIDDQHGQIAHLRPIRQCWPVFCQSGTAEADSEMEGTTLVDDTLQPQLSLHHLDQL